MPTLNKVKHVVVLMLENRSFDHMLGGVDFGGAAVDQPKRTEENVNSAGARVPIGFNAAPRIKAGPDHAHPGVMWQLTGRKSIPPGYCPPPQPIDKSGFVRSFDGVVAAANEKGAKLPANYGDTIMQCQPEKNVPVLATLAKEFAVCDAWFSSVPGETWPNRNYAHSGTSDGEDNIKKRLFKNGTIFQRLDDAGKKWRVYHDGIAQVWVFPHLWLDGFLRGRFRSFDDFVDDVKNNDLPEYTFIEPRHFGKKATSQHPDNPANDQSFHGGERLIKTIYDALTSNPQVWSSTLFVITYDEHGGFYDHVTPPAAVPPDEKGSEEGFRFGLLGVRVPAVLVSPWIPRGTVDHTVYDHCVIPRSVRELFAPGADALSNREAVAKTFLGNLSLNDARTDVPKVALSAEAEKSLASILPINTIAAMNGAPIPDELPAAEQPYAWLAFHVANVVENEKATGIASLGLRFWEDLSSRLSFKRTGDKDTIVIDGSDRLSAFGQHVADLLHSSAKS